LSRQAQTLSEAKARGEKREKNWLDADVRASYSLILVQTFFLSLSLTSNNNHTVSVVCVCVADTVTDNETEQDEAMERKDSEGKVGGGKEDEGEAEGEEEEDVEEEVGELVSEGTCVLAAFGSDIAGAVVVEVAAVVALEAPAGEELVRTVDELVVSVVVVAGGSAMGVTEIGSEAEVLALKTRKSAEEAEVEEAAVVVDTVSVMVLESILRTSLEATVSAVVVSVAKGTEASEGTSATARACFPCE